MGAERVLDENRHVRLSTVDVTLPDGTAFTQYVVRMPRCAMTLVLDDENRALLMYRHRFIIDRWVWELPGGYIDDAEDIAAAAAREVEGETGWRPREMQHLATFQPAIGTLDQPQHVYLSRGADPTGAAPDANETERVAWVPLGEAIEMIDRGLDAAEKVVISAAAWCLCELANPPELVLDLMNLVYEEALHLEAVGRLGTVASAAGAFRLERAGAPRAVVDVFAAIARQEANHNVTGFRWLTLLGATGRLHQRRLAVRPDDLDPTSGATGQHRPLHPRRRHGRQQRPDLQRVRLAVAHSVTRPAGAWLRPARARPGRLRPGDYDADRTSWWWWRRVRPGRRGGRPRASRRRARGRRAAWPGHLGAVPTARARPTAWGRPRASRAVATRDRAIPPGWPASAAR